MIKYHPTEYKLKGKGKYYYILYEHLERVRSGKKVWKPRAKRVYISGKLLSHKLGTFTNRYGKRVHGIKFVYENTRQGYHRRGFTAKRGRTKYRVSPTRVGRTKTTVSKLVELPRNIRRIRITTSKHRAEPTLMDVT